ncbi:hypothetical protein [Mesorhizobium sp. M7A.F.Ca.CA.002.12.1.1]|uniref:hypothetical protein n=1 Tax=Mesorhizobium sp. M7A.F.Ca.CA.002.12.1.1 TaxID=2496735 RepID=UPI000FCCDC45|nr:hypothetical protein [Mesorhizobium sp. M7A.F.Ca.CA.002.12.1.1]RUX60138.1 hypothetical protein EN989_10995 [Mesorhizobium sp. M7A.F.Ca.CA.002.12.1.1]
MTNNFKGTPEQILNQILVANGCWISSDGSVSPPKGMGQFAFEELVERCRKAAANAVQGLPLEPHWHDQNPWADRLTYVPIEELAECFMGLGRMVHLNDNEVTMCDVAFVLQNWAQYGDKLDAYILTGPLTTAGIRFGPDGPDYLSPGFSLPKLRALMLKYGSQERKSA